MTGIPQIKIIIGLLLAVAIFYNFGYSGERPMFKLSLLFLFGILSISSYFITKKFVGNLLFIFFMVILISITINWAMTSLCGKESNKEYLVGLGSENICDKESNKEYLVGLGSENILCKLYSSGNKSKNILGYHWKFWFLLIVTSIYLIYKNKHKIYFGCKT